MRSITIGLFICSLHLLSAQHCDPFTAQSTFIHQNFKYNILRGPEAFNELHYKVGIGNDGSMDSREYARIIYSSNIWAGGLAIDSSIHLAAGTYLNQDWVPGPLDFNGNTNSESCAMWDKVYTVTKEEIYEARAVYLENRPCSEIPESVRLWPARGNPFMSQPFENNLADYFDWDTDASYNPCAGDLPSVTIRGAEPESLVDYFERLPARISFYMMNDNGNAHYFSNGKPVEMHVGVYVFNYNTEDLKDVIFTYYKTEFKKDEDLEDFRFGHWFDFDLGCNTNDYLGTAKDQNMIYTYNFKNEELCNSNNEKLPGSQFGVSYLAGFREPYILVDNNGIDSLVIPPTNSGQMDTLVKAKMKSSIIPINCNLPENQIACTPQTPNAFQNILSGKNNNGESILDNDGNITQFMYSDAPSSSNGWSLCNDNSIPETTAIISSGPSLLQQGASERVLLAFCYAEDAVDGCSSISSLKYTQSMAQKMFENDFVHVTGPPPPVLNLSNQSDGILIDVEYYDEDYEELVQPVVDSPDNSYTFEGIKIFQVSSPNFDFTELNNPKFSRLIYQGDIVNDISTISNWKTSFNSDEKSHQAKLKVIGSNIGITDQILFDYDMLNDIPYDENKSYYFVAVSYGYNNYQDFSTEDESGQKYPYLESTCGLKVLNSGIILSDDLTNFSNAYIVQKLGNYWKIEAKDQRLMVRLYNASGQAILFQELNIGESLTSTYLNEMNAGIYFLHIFDTEGKNSETHKIVMTGN